MIGNFDFSTQISQQVQVAHSNFPKLLCLKVIFFINHTTIDHFACQKCANLTALYGTYVNCQSLLANSMFLMFSRWNFLLSYKFTRCKLGPLLFKHLVRDRGRSLHGTETVSERESMKLRRPLATVLVCHTGKIWGPIRTEYRSNQPLICKNWFLIVIIDLIVSRPASRLLYWLKWTFIPHPSL